MHLHLCISKIETYKAHAYSHAHTHTTNINVLLQGHWKVEKNPAVALSLLQMSP